MFYCLQERKPELSRASDLNFNLYCFWNALKDSPDKLISATQKIFNTKSEGKKLYNEIIDRRDTQLSELQRAVDFFVLNRITFSGVADSGGYSNESFLKRFTQSAINRLNEASSLIRNVNFFHYDYNTLLSLDGKDVFIFLDPPYYSVAKSRLYGKKGNLHTQFDHDAFFNRVSKCKHKWLITYDNSEYIRNLFKDFQQIEWELQYGMNNYKRERAAKGKELLISNYDIHSMK